MRGLGVYKGFLSSPLCVWTLHVLPAVAGFPAGAPVALTYIKNMCIRLIRLSLRSVPLYRALA